MNILFYLIIIRILAGFAWVQRKSFVFFKNIKIAAEIADPWSLKNNKPQEYLEVLIL
jgi:hypothetical protein